MPTSLRKIWLTGANVYGYRPQVPVELLDPDDLTNGRAVIKVSVTPRDGGPTVHRHVARKDLIEDDQAEHHTEMSKLYEQRDRADALEQCLSRETAAVARLTRDRDQLEEQRKQVQQEAEVLRQQLEGLKKRYDEQSVRLKEMDRLLRDRETAANRTEVSP